MTGVLLLGLVSCSSSGSDSASVTGWGGSSPSATPSASSSPTGATTPVAPAPSVSIEAESRETYLHPDGDYFGVATYNGPTAEGTDAVTQASGQRPRILQYYQGWKQPFKAADAELTYEQGALPLLTWEPRGRTLDKYQPEYALKQIAAGAHDAYIIGFARAVKATGRPLALRFAHEMNGTWYPWSEGNNGNSSGDYVKAYRHIHDLFQAVGATDVIWVWSPNVIRGAKAGLEPLYPGDQYVDWIGIDGYGFGESTATEVLQPTLNVLRKFSDKPVLLSETGSSPGSQQPGWTADLFRWINKTPNVIGFVWFQFSKDQGGQYDYRFDINPATKAAFRNGLNSLHLRAWPVATVLTQ